MLNTSVLRISDNKGIKKGILKYIILHFIIILLLRRMRHGQYQVFHRASHPALFDITVRVDFCCLSHPDEALEGKKSYCGRFLDISFTSPRNKKSSSIMYLCCIDFGNHEMLKLLRYLFYQMDHHKNIFSLTILMLSNKHTNYMCGTTICQISPDDFKPKSEKEVQQTE